MAGCQNGDVRLVPLALTLVFCALVTGCSRLSTCYIYNASDSDLIVVNTTEERRETFAVKPREWLRDLRAYHPVEWRFEYGYSKGALTAANVANAGSSRDDTFVAIDGSGLQVVGAPLWYLVERFGGPVLGVVIVAGVAVGIVVAVRRGRLRVRNEIE